MGHHEIIAPSFTRTDERGVFTEILNDGRWESLLAGQMKAGAVMGNHYHKETLVFFFLTSGSANIKTLHIDTRVRDEFRLEAQQGVILNPNESHAILFEQDSGFIMLKSLRY